MKRRAAAFDMTGGLLSAYPWIRFVAPNYSGYNILTTVNREFRAFLMVRFTRRSATISNESLTQKMYFFFRQQENIDEHKKNFVSGSETDLIDMFLNEMYSGKGAEAGFDGTRERLLFILTQGNS